VGLRHDFWGAVKRCNACHKTEQAENEAYSGRTENRFSFDVMTHSRERKFVYCSADTHAVCSQCDRTGLGNVFTVTGRMKCALSLASRKPIEFILKFYLCLWGRVTSLDLRSKYLLIMELHLDAMLYSNLCHQNSDAGHIKCSCGPHLAHGPQVPQPCDRRSNRYTTAYYGIGPGQRGPTNPALPAI